MALETHRLEGKTAENRKQLIERLYGWEVKYNPIVTGMVRILSCHVPLSKQKYNAYLLTSHERSGSTTPLLITTSSHLDAS